MTRAQIGGTGVAKKRTFVVVDANNHWLAYGEFASPGEAMKEGRRSTDPEYDPDVEVYVYEVASETRFAPEK